MVLGVIALGSPLRLGCAPGSGHEGHGGPGGPGRHRGAVLPVPAGPAPLLRRSLRPRVELGVPGGPVTHRLGIGPPLRGGHRWRAGPVGLSAQRAHRLHLLGHRRAAGHPGSSLRPLPPRLLRLAGHQDRHPVAGPFRRPPGPRTRRLGGGGDGDQHRGRRRSPAGDGDPSPVHLLWRVLPRHHDGRGRHPHQRRPAVRRAATCSGRCPARPRRRTQPEAGRPAGWLAPAGVGERTGAER